MDDNIFFNANVGALSRFVDIISDKNIYRCCKIIITLNIRIVDTFIRIKISIQ